VENLVSVLLESLYGSAPAGSVSDCCPSTGAEVFQFLSNERLLLDVIVPTLQRMSPTANSSGGKTGGLVSDAADGVLSRLLQEISDCREYWTEQQTQTQMQA
jgi:hypothetical protein